ncbi:Cytochrome P450 [Mycena kentingensis (nom. inval.)]|nr:Cytochrome P450 [Mycena kentingensis (nom. inval.)]
MPPIQPRTLTNMSPTLETLKTALATPSVLALVALVAYALVRLALTRRTTTIPGPRAFPLIGNLLDWPSEYQGEAMQKWAKVYGPITKLSILGKDILFVSGSRTITDLFVARGATCSDRPDLVFSGELCGLNILHPLSQYGDDFKAQRRFMKEVVAPDVLRSHWTLLEEEARRMCRAVWEDPASAVKHLRRSSTSFALRMVYGLPPLQLDDPKVRLAEEMMHISEYAIVGGWIVDFIPLLKHLPAWFPGASFQNRAKYYRAKILEMITMPWDEVGEQVLAGTETESFCSINMKKHQDGVSKHTETLIKATATGIYGGASDTAAASSHSLLLALLLHPQIQARAQYEIDALTNRERLPSLGDRKDLPYLGRVVWEVLRWGVPVPVTLPHRNRVEEVVSSVDGELTIAKNTMMVASLFSMSRDPEFHRSPETFNPDRYEGEKAERLPHYMFSLGPRRCPGADLAYLQLFQQAAAFLACFTISPAVDAFGMPVPVEPRFGGKVVRHPEDFQFTIEPRFSGAEKLFAE